MKLSMPHLKRNKKMSQDMKNILKDEMSWMNFCDQFPVSPFWVIHLPWRKPKIKKDQIPVGIKPSLIYGSGSNILTQAALKSIPGICSKLNKSKSRILDLGCGSGILAIACSKLGFLQVEGMDISLEAIDEAKYNAKMNKVKIHFSDKVYLSKRYDFIIANLYGSLFFNYLTTLKKIMKAGGYLYMVGFDGVQEEALIPLYKSSGFVVVETGTHEDWKYYIWTYNP